MFLSIHSDCLIVDSDLNYKKMRKQMQEIGIQREIIKICYWWNGMKHYDIMLEWIISLQSCILCAMLNMWKIQGRYSAAKEGVLLFEIPF